MEGTADGAFPFTAELTGELGVASTAHGSDFRAQVTGDLHRVATHPPRGANAARALAGFALLSGVVAVGLFYALILRGLPELYSLTDYRPNLVTRVRAADGTLIGEFARERREVVAIERIPEHVVRAFVSSEDDAFYEH